MRNLLNAGDIKLAYDNIYKLICMNGMTMRGLALELGLSENYFYNANQNRNLQFDVACAICDKFGVSISWLRENHNDTPINTMRGKNLPKEKHDEIIRMVKDGKSIAATARLVGVKYNTAYGVIRRDKEKSNEYNTNR